LGFRRNSFPFEPSLCRLRSPLPGNAISKPEKRAPIRRPSHRSAVSETKRSYKNPRQIAAFRTPSGNLHNCENAWWVREDSNLQPDHYERSALTIELRADALGANGARATRPRAAIAARTSGWRVQRGPACPENGAWRPFKAIHGDARVKGMLAADRAMDRRLVRYRRQTAALAVFSKAATSVDRARLGANSPCADGGDRVSQRGEDPNAKTQASFDRNEGTRWSNSRVPRRSLTTAQRMQTGDRPRARAPNRGDEAANCHL
jgi:hypothetical protein